MGDSGSVAAATAVVATGGSCTPTDQVAESDDEAASQSNRDVDYENKFSKVPSHVQSSCDISESNAHAASSSQAHKRNQTSNIIVDKILVDKSNNEMMAL